MSVNRFVVVVPVLAGLVVTGSAVARMMPAQSVRDTVYQTCAHNGVHFNKQGHPNCGLHLGWSNGDTGDTQPATEPGSTATAPTTGAGHGHKADGHGKGHLSHGQAAHTGHASHGHSGHVSHASSSHGNAGHGGGNGKGHGHSKG